jgi:hypothetical protein
VRGTTPNGRSFELKPRMSWLVDRSAAVIRGQDAGVPAPRPRQERLGDYWLPQRGHFVIGETVFRTSRASQGARVQDRSAHRLGESFVDALAHRDFARLAACFDARAKFRALIPAGLLEAESDSEAVRHFVAWFGGTSRLDLLHSSVGSVADRLHLVYRFRIDDAEEPRVIEQQAFCRVADGAICQIELLCSGFRPMDDRNPDSEGIRTEGTVSTDAT